MKTPSQPDTLDNTCKAMDMGNLPTDAKGPEPSLPRMSQSKLSLNASGLGATQRNLEGIISQNTSYFAHIQRACVCGICICGRCRCNAPKNLRISLNEGCLCSDYRTNFPGVTGVPPQNFKQKEPLFQHKGGDMRTIYKNDYVGHDSGTFKALQTEVFVPCNTTDPSLDSAKSPFAKNSVYGENYIDFKVALPHLMFRPSQVPTTDSRLPFIGHATNKEYGKFSPNEVATLEDGRRFAQSQFKNPITPDVQLPETTNSREAFQPYRNYDPVKLYRPEGEITVDKLPAFKNQFKTSGSTHDGEQNLICPARVILNRLAVRKLI